MKPNIPYPSRAEPVSQAPQTTPLDLPDQQGEQEPEAAPDSIRDRFARWLKNFVIYLGAVAVACATGIFFLWHLPFLQNFPEWIKSVSDASPSRLSTATVAPPPIAGGSQAPSSLPEPQAPAATPDPVPAQTGTIVVNTQPLESLSEPPADAGSPPTTPGQPTAPEAAQTDPAAAQLETPAAEVPAITAQQQEIQQLLADARLQMDDRRFTSPPSGNALRSYQRVLELEPANPIAAEGIQRISTYYQDIAKQSLLEGRTDESLAYINRGLRAAPNNATLLNLRKEARSAKQREEQQRQALLEEKRRQEAEQQARRQEAEPMRELSRQPPAGERQQQQPWWQRQQQQPAFNESGFNQR